MQTLLPPPGPSAFFFPPLNISADIPPTYRGEGLFSAPRSQRLSFCMHTDRLGAAHFVGARTQYPIQLHRCPFFHLPQACSRVTACPYFRNACLRRPRQPLLLRILPMPVVVAEMVPVKSRFCLMVNSARARLRRERGPHIDRHLMGRCRPSLSQIVAGRTDDDIRRYSGPTGLKRRQQRGSHAFLHCFGAFSQRDAARLLPRFFQPVVRLLCPFFVHGFVAG